MNNTWCNSLAGTLLAVGLLATAPVCSFFFPDIFDQGASVNPQHDAGQPDGNQDGTRRSLRSVDRPRGSRADQQPSNLSPENREFEQLRHPSSQISRQQRPVNFRPLVPPLNRHHYCRADEGDCRPPVSQFRREIGSRVDRACKWQLAFKAVRGSDRSISEDYLQLLAVNMGLEAAKTPSSPFPYADESILNNWDHLLIQQVKMEIFNDGERLVWFLFDGLGSNKLNWMSQRRLIASPFNTPLKTEFNVSFAVLNNETMYRMFDVSYRDCTSSAECGIFVVDNDPTSSSPCTWESNFTRPYFFYKSFDTPADLFEGEGEIRCGDRFLISTKICDPDQWID